MRFFISFLCTFSLRGLFVTYVVAEGKIRQSVPPVFPKKEYLLMEVFLRCSIMINLDDLLWIGLDI